MTGKVTSITEIRSAIQRREARVKTTNRTVSTLLLVVAALILIGLAATISASSAVAIQSQADQFHFLKRQLLGLGLGTVALLTAAFVPYQWYRKLAVPLTAVSLILLVVVLMVGSVVNGAKSWLHLGPVSFQPAELAKFSAIVSLAAAYERKHRSLGDLGHFLAPMAVYVGLPAALIMFQTDVGAVLVMGAAAMAVAAVSAAPFRFVTVTSATSFVTALTLILAGGGERSRRLTAFLDPWADPSGDSWQLVQGYYALGTGGLFGSGLGNSRARWFYLPNAHTDFIFAIIGEETGIVGAGVVLALFAVLAATGWMIANRARDAFGRMLAIGLTAWFIIQAVVNVGGVLGVLPITGVTLPFVSYGGTSLAISMAVAGVLISIAAAPTSRRRSRRTAAPSAASPPRSGRSRAGRSPSGQTSTGRRPSRRR